MEKENKTKISCQKSQPLILLRNYKVVLYCFFIYYYLGQKNKKNVQTSKLEILHIIINIMHSHFPPAGGAIDKLYVLSSFTLLPCCLLSSVDKAEIETCKCARTVTLSPSPPQRYVQNYRNLPEQEVLLLCLMLDNPQCFCHVLHIYV